MAGMPIRRARNNSGLKVEITEYWWANGAPRPIPVASAEVSLHGGQQVLDVGAHLSRTAPGFWEVNAPALEHIYGDEIRKTGLSVATVAAAITAALDQSACDSLVEDYQGHNF
jgi:hypothetical protein